MANVRLSIAAKDRISSYKYIAKELHSPVTADNTVGSIFDPLERLERHLSRSHSSTFTFLMPS